jgi:hypothetical protein
LSSATGAHGLEESPGGVTLVAFYGDKPPALERLVVRLGRRLATETRGRFQAYATPQVHATLVGLEGVRSGGRIYNRNYLEVRGEQRAMDPAALLAVVRQRLPITVRIGGFDAGRPYPFTSRGEHPHRRSFCLRGSTAVAMGWPFDDGGYPSSLDALRRAANAAGVLHKYHRSDDDVDNDFFFVLGRIDDPPHPAAIQQVLRRELAEQEPIHLILDTDTLRIVAYRDPRLPVDEGRSWRLAALETHRDEILEASATVT